MAGRGPAPKETHSRARDTARRAAPATIIKADGAKHGPELPDLPEYDGEPQCWPDATIDWWETWRTSPQAQTFTDTDWSFLLDTAVLHMAFWDGDRSVAAELRLRAAKFGATPEDRARLKIAVGVPKPEGAPKRERTPAARTRRTRVLRAVGDE